MKGAKGTSKNPFTFGSTMGPPALIAYAVDPVGVLIIRPSERNVSTGIPSTITEKFSIFAGRSVTITASFRAQL